MSCYGCNKKYGLFCKEYGCPNCGYSYCSKCLNRPIAVPKHNAKVMSVCLICFDKLSKRMASEKVIDYEPISGCLISSLKSTSRNEGILDLEDCPSDLGNVLAPIALTTPSMEDSKNGEIDENLDRTLSKRLKDLKFGDKLPSDDELRSRLYNLSGRPLNECSKNNFLTTDQRTDQEKTNDLIAQFMQESDLDHKNPSQQCDNPISEIERRLAALRDIDASTERPSRRESNVAQCNTPSDNEDDDETILKDIMTRYLSEARLAASKSDLEKELDNGFPPAPPIGNGSTEPDTGELRWCNICNEDAVIRCKGCGGELFCAQCFRECHDDDEEYQNHVTEKYHEPPKFKEDHF